MLPFRIKDGLLGVISERIGVRALCDLDC